MWLSQWYPLLWWCMTGVSRVALVEGIIDVLRTFSSTDIKTRGKLVPLPE